ncbi:MAG: beta-CASP ribonuclease aCPSF1 [Candidatus Methanomethylicia archaeon]|jgi:KH/beta-lactamase-domain protein|uniref:Transcription termination factor FttA n=1 Tax=Thermoproteota archaeon TaxID=2056631 RepID=A0A523B980_9CREN|nr:beta-CASP ribonuclease aCPSF1 [Candidatus Methanomethylicia archaeon]MCQ5374708.1 beta-CASP ribonuclease aCPSF1 [Candidatus Methanomethylicia archaeon]TDA37463.1 MAG: beta-CASP ribonuclease aCPSF1 [Candidatus Verstraetearchaeota archaeon]
MANQGTFDTFAEIKKVVLREIPADARLTKVEFEGPNIVVYVQNPNLLIENSEPVKRIVHEIKKRIIIRADPSARKTQEEAKKIIEEIIPKEAEITEMNFDEGTGEVTILAKKPGLVIGKGGSTLRDIAYHTGWRATIVRSPPLKSRIVEQTLYYMSKENEYRLQFLRKVGRRIHRPPLYKSEWVTITALGGFREVGRQAILVQTLDSKVLIDCGVKPGAQSPLEEFPRLDEMDLQDLDAVIVTHAHLDHCGLVPLLFKYGYNGPVYCTKPTKSLMILLQLDYLDVAVKEGRPPPYGLKEVKKELLNTIALDYGEVTDISPDIRLTLHNAGHILGSAMVHLHIGEGFHNIVYTGDFKYARTRLLEPATSSFPRAETLIMESTYGAPNDVVPSREETERLFLEHIKSTIQRGGKVLIPILAVGRAQEIMLVLDEAIKLGTIPQVPVYIEGMLQEVTAIHTAYPEDLARDLKNRIFHKGENPFLSEHFVSVDDKSARPDIAEGSPCIIMATSGMLTGGPALEYFRLLAPDPKNTMIFVNYQIEGTLGRSILRGVREVPLTDPTGKLNVVEVKMNVVSMDGFSGHSDRKQLLRFVNNLSPRPKQILVAHGEESKCISLSESVRRFFRVEATAPSVGERIRAK